MNMIFMLLSLLLALPCWSDPSQQKAAGFHWYTQEQTPKKIKRRVQSIPKTPVATPSPYERLITMRKNTLNILAQALISPSFDATKNYMEAQMVYAKKNQEFVRYWQQVLLVHPELDNTLNFPTNNSAIALRNEGSKALRERVVKECAARYGLIFFYRGHSSLSQKMVSTLLPFIEENHFSMVSVSTDNELIEGLPHSKTVPIELLAHKMKLKAKYLPALFLVDLKQQKMSPLAYGFISLSDLQERILDVMTDFRRLSYEGLSE